MTGVIVIAGACALVAIVVTYRMKRVPLGPDAYIWDTTDGLHRVIVNGNQVGVWSKRRWAERDLREQVRTLEALEEDYQP